LVAKNHKTGEQIKIEVLALRSEFASKKAGFGYFKIENTDVFPVASGSKEMRIFFFFRLFENSRQEKAFPSMIFLQRLRKKKIFRRFDFRSG